MDEDNLTRVRAIMGLFGLSIAQVAKAGGASRPYVSMALAGRLKPSPAFWRRLEGNLGRLVEGRHGQVFTITVTAIGETALMAIAGIAPDAGHQTA